MRYRADIEGLRALAIMLVVVAHAEIPGMHGGFIGVDIFFVISGYLITGLLLEEYQREGRLDLLRFYARRFRRLLPALLVMLLLTAVVGWQLLPPSSQPAQAGSGLAASVWLSNMHFAFSKLGYFDPGAETNLYLHTWSLGVEEQFYLVWPALIILVVASGNRVTSSARRLPFAMVLLAILSFVLCVWLTRRSANHAFYLMPARAWQFAVGALAFLLVHKGRVLHAWIGGRWVGIGMGAIGLGLIGFALLVLEDKTPYPGAWSLLPTMGTALLLLSGIRSNMNPFVHILAAYPMQAIGRVSYSWYLWHWPVLILGAEVMPIPTMWNRLWLVIISLVLAVASYRLVEAPLRRNAKLIERPGRAVVGSLALMALLVLGNVQWLESAGERHQENASQGGRYRPLVPSIYAMGCDDWYQSADVQPCVFGNPAARNTVVVMGDSIGLHWFPAYERIFSTSDWRLLVLTKSSCPMVDEPIYYARIGREFVECQIWLRRSLDYIAELSPDLVILGSSHRVAYAREEWVEGTQAVLSRLSPHVGGVVIMRSTPWLPLNGAKCLEPRGPLYDLLSSVEYACVGVPDNRLSDDVTSWIREAADSYPNVRLIDMDDVVCPQGICRAVIGDRLVYRDSQHLNADFVASLAGVLAERLDVTPAGIVAE